MADNSFPYQPGVMLHEAIVGAFRASGGSFEVWCAENAINPSNARNATYGVMKGPKGQELLARLIDAAGSEVVKAGYMARLRKHVSMLKGGAR